MQTESNFWLTLFGMILGSSLISTIFSKVFDLITGRRKAYQILLLSAMEQLVDKIIAQGYRTAIQTQRLTEIKEQYKKQGGNGYADAMYNEAITKPFLTSMKGEGIADV